MLLKSVISCPLLTLNHLRFLTSALSDSSVRRRSIVTIHTCCWLHFYTIVFQCWVISLILRPFSHWSTLKTSSQKSQPFPKVDISTCKQISTTISFEVQLAAVVSWEWVELLPSRSLRWTFWELTLWELTFLGRMLTVSCWAVQLYLQPLRAPSVIRTAAEDPSSQIWNLRSLIWIVNLKTICGLKFFLVIYSWWCLSRYLERQW